MVDAPQIRQRRGIRARRGAIMRTPSSRCSLCGTLACVWLLAGWQDVAAPPQRIQCGVIRAATCPVLVMRQQ